MKPHEQDTQFIQQLAVLTDAMGRVLTKQAIDAFAEQRVEQWYIEKLTREFAAHCTGDLLDCVVLYARCQQLADTFSATLEPSTGAFGAGRITWSATVDGRLLQGLTIELEPHERWRFIRKLLLAAHEALHQARRR